ncbi:hypothetical protein [Bacillus badius]|uniref:hypothetical protein n=1 Tax=Bacillus badius TaxID=1455 RepID=UPI0007B3548B|nr:hypothetical protein [Bacillus badius]KZR59334.1 hypothetical protein A3781_13110 [Bacillus badius]
MDIKKIVGLFFALLLLVVAIFGSTFYFKKEVVSEKEIINETEKKPVEDEYIKEGLKVSTINDFQKQQPNDEKDTTKKNETQKEKAASSSFNDDLTKNNPQKNAKVINKIEPTKPRTSEKAEKAQINGIVAQAPVDSTIKENKVKNQTVVESKGIKIVIPNSKDTQRDKNTVVTKEKPKLPSALPNPKEPSKEELKKQNEAMKKVAPLYSGYELLNGGEGSFFVKKNGSIIHSNVNKVFMITDFSDGSIQIASKAIKALGHPMSEGEIKGNILKAKKGQSTEKGNIHFYQTSATITIKW